MTKNLGAYDGRRQEPAARERPRKLLNFAFSAFFPLLIVAVAYLVGRTFFGM